MTRPIVRFLEELTEVDRRVIEHQAVERWTGKSLVDRLVVAAWQELLIWQAEQDRAARELLDQIDDAV